MNNPKVSFTLMCLGVILQSFGADYVFNGPGTTLDARENWNPNGLPQQGDKVTFNKNFDTPYTLLGNSFSVLSMTVSKNSVFDLGVGKSFLADNDPNNSKFTIGAENTTVELRSGTFGIGDSGNRFFVGDGRKNTTFIATGENSILRSAHNSYIIVGQNQINNSLIIKDGATLLGGVAVGLASNVAISNKVIITGEGSRFISNNQHYTATSGNEDGQYPSLEIGAAGSFSEFTVSNKAQMVVGDNRCVLMNTKYGSTIPGSHNLFKVTHEATASIPNLIVGYDGNSNKVEVLAGGELSVSNILYVGHKSKTDSSKPIIGNTVLVSGEGSRLYAKNIYFGKARCTESLVRVENGGTLECDGNIHVGINPSSNHNFYVSSNGRLLLNNATFEIGQNNNSNSTVKFTGGILASTNSSDAASILMIGSNPRLSFLDGSYACISNTYLSILDETTNALFEIRGGSTFVARGGADTRNNLSGINTRIVIDGSTYDGDGFICLAPRTTSVSNKIEIINGASVSLYRIVCGDNGLYASLDVNDSTLNLTGTLGFGYSIKGNANAHASLNITGESANITVKNEFMPFNNTAINITIPEDGFVNQPVIKCGMFILSDTTTPSFNITRSTKHLDKDRIVLLKATQADIDMEKFLSTYSISLPEGCKLDLSNAREIAITLPSLRGTILYLK